MAGCCSRKEQGHTPLVLACRRKKVIHLRAYIDAFPDGIREADEQGNLPLHIAATYLSRYGDYSDYLRDLISAYPRAVGVKNNDGDLSIHLASNKGMGTARYVVDILADASPESLRVRNDQGLLSVHLFVGADYCDVDREVINVFAAVDRQAFQQRTPMAIFHFTWH